MANIRDFIEEIARHIESPENFEFWFDDKNVSDIDGWISPILMFRKNTANFSIIFRPYLKSIEIDSKYYNLYPEEFLRLQDARYTRINKLSEMNKKEIVKNDAEFLSFVRGILA